jgi:outer membrane protein assembly factor BamB
MNAARQFWPSLCAAVCALTVMSYPGSTSLAADWPEFRGNGRGVSLDRLNTQWSGSVTTAVWRVRLTNCLGSLTVRDGKVFTQSRRAVANADREVCVALDASTGAELWATPVDYASYPHGGVGYDDGPRSTPVCYGDSVYVLSSYLKLYRLNATNGAIVWSLDLVDSFDGQVIAWQNAASPVVADDLIFLNANCGPDSLMALRIADGSVAWRSQNEGMTHSTPTLTTILGERQIIFATHNGLVALNPTSGALLWRANYPFNYGTSLSVQPVVYDDMIFVSGAHSYGMGSMVVRASVSNGTWSATRLWSTNNPAMHWMTPVVRDGFLYGQFGIQSFDSVNAQLKCVEMRTGVVKWSANGFGRCATVLADDHLVAVTERGAVVLVRPSTNAYTELARFTAIPAYHDFSNKCWNVPAFSDGRLFVRSTAYVALFDLSIPSLKLDLPSILANQALNVSIRTVSGAPVASNRLAGIELWSSTNLAFGLTQWNRITNPLVLGNGVVRATNLNAGGAGKFFIVNETPIAPP